MALSDEQIYWTATHTQGLENRETWGTGRERECVGAVGTFCLVQAALSLLPLG